MENVATCEHHAPMVCKHVGQGSAENFLKADELALIKKAKRSFPRELETATQPLKRALRRFFRKIVKREIAKLQRAGTLRLFSSRAGGQVRKAEVTLKKAISQKDRKQFGELVKTYGIRTQERAGKRTAKQLGGKWSVRPEDQTRFIAERELVWGKTLNQINVDLEDTFRDVLVDSANAEPRPGINTITRNLFDAALSAGGVISPGRAERIARTEMHVFQNDGIYKGYRASGIKKLRWVTIMDGRERREKRTNHALQSNVTVPVGSAFVMKASGGKLRYPGDTSLGAKPFDTVNCRCTTVPVIE